MSQKDKMHNHFDKGSRHLLALRSGRLGRELPRWRLTCRWGSRRAASAGATTGNNISKRKVQGVFDSK